MAARLRLAHRMGWEMPSDMDLQAEYDRLSRERAARGTPEILKGECTAFCPYHELLHRRLNNEISEYERTMPVKKYYRSAAGYQGSLPEDVRAAGTLSECLDYLMRFSVDRTSFAFLENRIRAVKADLLIQPTVEESVRVSILEKIVRWYIYSMYVLYTEVSIDLHLIMEQLQKTLTTLLPVYEEAGGDKNYDRTRHTTHGSANGGAHDSSPEQVYPNRSEFVAYKILAGLGDSRAFDTYAADDCYVRQALSILLCYQSTDFYSYYHRMVPDFMSYSILLYWEERFKANIMELLQKGLNETIPVSKMHSVVGFDPKPLLEAHFYTVTDTVNLKEKNRTAMDIPRVARREYSNPNVYLMHGNIDFRYYQSAVREWVYRRIRVRRIFRQLIRLFIGQKIDRGHSAAKAVQQFRMDAYIGGVVNYIRRACYKIVIRTWLKQLFQLPNRILVVGCSSKRPSQPVRLRPADPRFDLFYNMSAEVAAWFANFSFCSDISAVDEDMALRHNLTVFLVPEHLELIISEKFYMLNKLINPLGESITSAHINRRVHKVVLSDILRNKDLKTQIETLVSLKEYLPDYHEILQALIDRKYFRDRTIYYYD